MTNTSSFIIIIIISQRHDLAPDGVVESVQIICDFNSMFACTAPIVPRLEQMLKLSTETWKLPEDAADPLGCELGPSNSAPQSLSSLRSTGTDWDVELDLRVLKECMLYHTRLSELETHAPDPRVKVPFVSYQEAEKRLHNSILPRLKYHYWQPRWQDGSTIAVLRECPKAPRLTSNDDWALLYYLGALGCKNERQVQWSKIKVPLLERFTARTLENAFNRLKRKVPNHRDMPFQGMPRSVAVCDL